MRRETADYLFKASEEIGIDDVKVDENYSGRGMYGSATSAIVCDLSDLFQMIAVAALRVHENEDIEDQDYGHFDFTEDVKRIRRDNMGRDSLVFY